MLNNTILAFAKVLRKFNFKKPDFESIYFDNVAFADDAKEEYIRVSEMEKKRIDKLIRDIWINGLAIGKGKPEIITFKEGYDDSFWSRRITEKNRLCYQQIRDVDYNSILLILSCNKHYRDK